MQILSCRLFPMFEDSTISKRLDTIQAFAWISICPPGQSLSRVSLSFAEALTRIHHYRIPVECKYHVLRIVSDRPHRKPASISSVALRPNARKSWTMHSTRWLYIHIIKYAEPFAYIHRHKYAVSAHSRSHPPDTSGGISSSRTCSISYRILVRFGL